MGSKLYNCPKCGKSYMLLSCLKTHMLSHVNDSVYKCSKCHVTFFGEDLLKEHVLHSVCNANFDENSLQIHDIQGFSTSFSDCKGTKNKLKELKVYRRRFKCLKCQETFLEKADYKAHMFSTHLCNIGLDSSISTKAQKDVSGSEKVRLVMRSNVCIDMPDSDTRFTCNRGYSLKSSTSKDVYQIAVCPVCRESFSTEDDLKVHMAVHASNSESRVSVACGMQDRQEVSREKCRSEGDENIQCFKTEIECSTFNTGCSSPKENQKNFLCPKWPAIYFTESELEEHGLSNLSNVNGTYRMENDTILINNSQTDIRSIPCEGNNEGFLPSGEQQSKFKTLFKCRNCPMTFFLRTEIDRHILSHNLKTVKKVPEMRGRFSRDQLQKTFDIFFKCTNCPLIFLEKTEVENHVLTHCIDCTGVLIKSQSSESSMDIPQQNAVLSASESTITVFPSNECLVCSTFFLNEMELEHHMLSCHQDFSSNVSFPVEFCSTDMYGQNIVISGFNFAEDNYVNDCMLPEYGLSTYDLQNVKAIASLGGKSYKCLVCSKELDDEKKLVNHKRIHGNKNHICQVCNKSFRANSYLKAHMSVHSDARPYKCSSCDKCFKSITTLKMHKAVHLDTRPFKCLVCKATFKHKNSLTLHQLVHTTSRPFKCVICKKCFKSSSAFKGHMKIHSDKSPNEKKLYYCSECCKTYSNEKNYQYHMRIHSGDVPHKCQYCGKGFVVKPFLTQHLRIHTGERPFKCPKCEKRFAVKSTLRNHMDTHSEVKRYVCHICGIHITQRQTLSSHLKKHTGAKQHRCDICGKSFFLKSNFIRHMRIHSGERPYQCLLCNKNFKQNTHLKNHMALHKGEKPYKCSICNKCFTYKSSLNNHMVTHSQERPFACSKCDRRFRNKSSLKVHLLTHDTGEKFTCPECGKKFKLESSLQVHLKKTIEGVSFPCRICKKVFTRRACLYRHKNSHSLETEDFDAEIEKLKNSNELESIKVTEVLDNFDGHEGIQVHIIV